MYRKKQGNKKMKPEKKNISYEEASSSKFEILETSPEIIVAISSMLYTDVWNDDCNHIFKYCQEVNSICLCKGQEYNSDYKEEKYITKIIKKAFEMYPNKDLINIGKDNYYYIK